jgi:large subunit ribosomal protein L23
MAQAAAPASRVRSPYKVIIEPVLTERSLAQAQQDPPKYQFRVLADADKTEIKSAIEAIYNVKVEKVNTVVRKGKAGRFGFRFLGKRQDQKFAVVTLAKGQPPITFY